MVSVGWLAAVVVFAVVEALTVGLTSIWFALGALGALAASELGFNLWVQFGVFIVLSGVSMLLLRPLARKYLKPGYTATNADRLIGQTAVVTEAVDDLAGTGAARVSGQIWSAKPARPELVIPVGSKVRVLSIQGVKVLVEPLEEAK